LPSGPGPIRRAPGVLGKCLSSSYRHQVPGLAVFPAELAGRPPAVAAVCTECLDLCDEIIAEELLGPK